MQEEIYKQLLEVINKENILLNEPMSKHTSFKTGGNAKFFVKAYSISEIKKVLKIVKENKIPLFILGNGTNLLVKDKGFDGIVLQIKLNDINIVDNIVTVDAGVKNAVLSNKILEKGLTGFEFASGIPGTIGGAIKMNAGAYGNEMKDIVQEVTYIDFEGNVNTISNEQCKFEYRNSIFFKLNCVILQTKLKLEQGNKEEIQNKIKELAIQRKEKQPLEYPNAGSTFKRGEDFITAKVIDECGLKGYSIGGAEVSQKHAGFIINKNNATSKDILDLIKYVQSTVKEETGKEIKLEIEVI